MIFFFRHVRRQFLTSDVLRKNITLKKISRPKNVLKGITNKMTRDIYFFIVIFFFRNFYVVHPYFFPDLETKRGGA